MKVKMEIELNDERRAFLRWCQEEIDSAESDFSKHFVNQKIAKRFFQDFDLSKDVVDLSMNQWWMLSCFMFFEIKNRASPWPEAESFIREFSIFSLAYARDCIKGRWEPGEAAIAGDDKLAFRYSKNILKSRFKLGEPAIFKHPYLGVEYCLLFKIRNEEVEQKIGEGMLKYEYWGGDHTIRFLGNVVHYCHNHNLKLAFVEA